MTVILRHSFLKPNVANELVHPKLTRTRTTPEPTPTYPEKLATKWILPDFTFAPQNSEKLKTRDSAPRPTCSRSARSGGVCAGMGVRRPGVKLAKRRLIRRPGVVSRAAVGPGSRVRRGRSPGCRRGRGGRFSGFQFFRKRTLEIALGMTAKCPKR